MTNAVTSLLIRGLDSNDEVLQVRILALEPNSVRAGKTVRVGGGRSCRLPPLVGNRGKSNSRLRLSSLVNAEASSHRLG